jgi:phi13 family phage major tail protein
MAIEYRGCRQLVYAPVTADAVTGITFGAVKTLAPVQKISHEATRENKKVYYDDELTNVIYGKSAGTVTFTIGVPSDEVLADIQGKFYDPTTGAFSDTDSNEDKFFACGYIMGEVGDAEDEDYVWKCKGTFEVTGTEHVTKDDGTDTTNITLAYTCVDPKARFTHGGADGMGGKSKGVRVKASKSTMTEEVFFATAQTIDTYLAYEPEDPEDPPEGE